MKRVSIIVVLVLLASGTAVPQDLNVRWIHGSAPCTDTHIEMTSEPGVDYPVRTTYQPEEHALAMTPANILELRDAVSKMGDTPVRETHKDFIVYPW